MNTEHYEQAGQEINEFVNTLSNKYDLPLAILGGMFAAVAADIFHTTMEKK